MKESAEAGTRKIIHVDMDAFFASVEQRDNAQLRGRPVAVGGSKQRGVVAAASYEARRFGVRSAMPSVTAARKCPDLVFVPARFEVYRAVSQQIREVFKYYSDLVEPLSLDEAYLDVTSDRQRVGSATGTAEAIRRDILRQTGLTASAGVSYNKFLAKIASDQNKPDGLCVIKPAEGAGFVEALPVRRFFGVGPRTAERMARLGIHTGADLRDCELAFLQEHFGKSAQYLYHASRGIDKRQVRPDRIRKSVGRERTFSSDLASAAELRAALTEIIESVWARIEDNGVCGRTVTLKVKYADFKQITRSQSFYEPVADKATFGEAGLRLLDEIIPVDRGVRLLGLTLSNLEQPGPIGTDAAFAGASMASYEQKSFDF